MRPTAGMWYRGMGHMGNRAQGVWGTRGMGHVDNGIDGQWGTGVWDMGNGAHGRFAPKISKRCQVVKKMSSCQKDVKLSKKCQVAKKMSNVKNSNT